MNYGHVLLAKGQQQTALDFYRRSREAFEDNAAFFKGMEADFTDANLSQYGIREEGYRSLIEQLRNEARE